MSMQVVIRALDILTHLSRHSTGLLLGEISDGLGLPVATCHRILGVLEQQNFLTRSATNRKYFLGPAARELGASDQQHSPTFATRHPAIDTAGRITGETVFVCEPVADTVVCTTLTESIHPLRLFVRLGQKMPLHAAASARALLAWRPESEIRHMLSAISLTAYTADTPATVDAVVDHLAVVRRRGYDVCESELDENVYAVSVPIRAVDGDIVATATLAAPSQRMQDATVRQEALDTVLACAAEMSADLGWNS